MKSPRVAAASRAAGETITQPACEADRSFRNLGFERKLSSLVLALCSGASRSIERAASPCNSPPRASTMTASCSATAASAGLLAGRGRRRRRAGRSGGVERLDHLVGDVVLGVDVDRLLQDGVVLLGFGDLLDDAVGALVHRLQLFV